MSTTLFEITVEYMDGRTETISYGWSRQPSDGVLHLYDVENTERSRSVILSNVRAYDVRRIR